MKVFPAMHYTMGGIWVNGEDQATNVPGIYAAGECEYQYHGANRLGANSLVSCIFGGGLAGPAAVKYAKNLEKDAEATASTVFDREKKRQEEKNQALLSQDGTENPMTIWRELGDIMTEHVTVTRINKNLEKADAQIRACKSEPRNELSDRTLVESTRSICARIENMIILARQTWALARNESRGAHTAQFPGSRRRPLAKPRAKW
jgi:succinate dehydrogenase / fumarate reductase flavoprotein subunit